jgi:hypothetical protein
MNQHREGVGFVVPVKCGSPVQTEHIRWDVPPLTDPLQSAEPQDVIMTGNLCRVSQPRSIPGGAAAHQLLKVAVDERTIVRLKLPELLEFPER